jgi:hypothetical protein
MNPGLTELIEAADEGWTGIANKWIGGQGVGL